jgi:hypothetical protein
MSVTELKRPTFPAAVFVGYVIAFSFIESLYLLRQVEIPIAYELLSKLAFVWAIWWWLIDDSRRRSMGSMLDLGMFLLLAWMILLPYHLFKTRRVRAFIPILVYILAIVSGRFAAAIVFLLY